AFSVISLFVKNVRQSLNRVRSSTHVIAEYVITHERVKGMSVVSVLLGLVRSSFNMLRFSIRAIVEGIDSIRRIE
ncbi:hypothetical protein SK128_021368, partial [Halocaridina rubra]